MTQIEYDKIMERLNHEYREEARVIKDEIRATDSEKRQLSIELQEIRSKIYELRQQNSERLIKLQELRIAFLRKKEQVIAEMYGQECAEA